MVSHTWYATNPMQQRQNSSLYHPPAVLVLAAALTLLSPLGLAGAAFLGAAAFLAASGSRGETGQHMNDMTRREMHI